MDNSIVRLTGIKLKNFKNVKYGELDFCNRRKEYNASILGLYGQNGSGKTALIEALQILKYLLCGKEIPEDFWDCINVDAEQAELQFIFDVRIPKYSEKYEAYYEFKMKKEVTEYAYNWNEKKNDEQKTRLVIYDEILSYSYADKRVKVRKGPLIDTCTESVFVPVSKYECLIGKDKDIMTDLIVAKKFAYKTSRSFIFSPELLNANRKQQFDMEKQDGELSLEFVRHRVLLIRLALYGNSELFVIDTANTGLISMNALPLIFKYEDEENESVGLSTLPLDGPAIVEKGKADVVYKIVNNMNIVLQQIVPGLTISLKDLGTQVMDDGKIGNRVQLMSHKNSKEIPLKNESDGIKKIISILQLLIVVYNNPSITVAIDELDSGIFEYLLGELLRIISEKGKGQLIFTSHNLRPLETIDRGFIAFTTTNPEMRYIRMSKVKDNNNLRDFYFRDIVLGEQNEELYEPTNNAEIAFAFREAGEVSGT